MFPKMSVTLLKFLKCFAILLLFLLHIITVVESRKKDHRFISTITKQDKNYNSERDTDAQNTKQTIMRPRMRVQLEREWVNEEDLAKDSVEADEGTSTCSWGEWSEWCACSVSCGRGREIRWRKRIHAHERNVRCELRDEGDYQIEQRMCQLPECDSWENLLGSITGGSSTT